MIFVSNQVHTYMAEVSAPGVNNMMGTMEWLWCLGVLHPMQFFHTLMPFRLSPLLLGRMRRVWARREMVAMSMTMTTLLSAPSPLPSLLRAWPCATVRARRGWAWARAMLRRRAAGEGVGKGKGESKGIGEGEGDRKSVV